MAVLSSTYVSQRYGQPVVLSVTTKSAGSSVSAVDVCSGGSQTEVFPCFAQFLYNKCRDSASDQATSDSCHVL
jgi:hypothetical protein